MAEPVGVEPEAAPLSSVVKSKLSTKSTKRRITDSPTRSTTPEPPPTPQSEPTRNFDRDPVFLVMASGQIELAEVIRVYVCTSTCKLN